MAMNRYEGSTNIYANQRGVQRPVQRHGESGMSVTDPLAGIYNTWNNNSNPLFDISVDDSLMALAWQDSVHPILDILGFQNSIEYKDEQGYITYIAPSGQAAGTPSTGIITDPCADGNSTEFGSAVRQVTGWTRFRRTSESFDITQLGMKPYEKFPIFSVDGQRIEDDYAWSVMRLMMVQIQDLHEWFLDGDSAVSGETDGIYNTLDGTAVDANTAANIPALANPVVNWNGSAIDSSSLATVTGMRAFSIPDGFSLWNVLRDWLQSTKVRLRTSSLPVQRAGFEVHFLTHGQLMSCLIDSWLCETFCLDTSNETNGKRVVSDAEELRRERERIRQALAMGVFTVVLDGIRVYFWEYDWGTSLDNGDGTYNIVGFVPEVANQKTFMLHAKDMSAAQDHPMIMDADFLVSDNGRVLSWERLDNTCLKYHSEFQTRLGIFNKWLGIKIENIACSDTTFFASGNPNSSLFLGTSAVNLANAANWQTAAGGAVL